jgi:thioredoxin-related protein
LLSKPKGFNFGGNSETNYKKSKFKVNMKFLLTIVLACFMSASFAQGINFVGEDMKWADILKKAKTENKIVFVDAFTTWCGPCKQMSRVVFVDKSVGDVYNASFVNAKIDMEKGEGLDIARKYGVRAYPTYIFVNGDGELVHRSLGMMPADKFVEVAKAAVNPETQFYTLKKKYKDGEKSPDFLKAFSYSCKDAQDEKLAVEVAASYMATQKDWLTDENKAYIMQFSQSIESPLYAYVLKNKAEFIKNFSKDNIEEALENTAMDNIAQFSFDRLKKEFDLAKAMEYGSKYLPKSDAEKVVSFLTLRQFQMKQDMTNTIQYALKHFEKYPSENANTLNEYAWLFYEHSNEKFQTEQALAWSLKSVEINDNAAFNDTVASLYFKLGNKVKAKEFAEKAIKQGKEVGEDMKETELLLKKIEMM